MIKQTILRSSLLLLGSLMTSLSFAEKGPATIAVYDLDGALSESGQITPSLLDLNFSSELPTTLLDVSRSMEKAAKDEDIKGVVVEIDQASLGLAQVEEIHRRLKAIKEAGKDVWIYTDYFKNTSALLGSVATKFVMMPEGNVSFSGLYTESMYFKNLLDKIGVSAQIVHIGDFKSYGETYYRTGPSEFAQKQTNELLDGIFKVIVDQISNGRGISQEKVLELINTGNLSPQDLLKHKLIDQLMHRTDFVDALYAHYGQDTEFDHSYAMRSLKGPKVEGIMDLFKLMFQSKNGRSHSKPYVGVVVLEGAITDASIAPVRDEILQLVEDDENLQGLVLRVNSPGGSALASEVLWEAIDEFKEVTELPFVVSMGGVAASGGYYVSAGADYIFAERGTITGSIGVVGMKLVTEKALNMLGITTHSQQRGKHAGAMTTTRAFTPEEETFVRTSMLKVYDTFLKRVSDGRGNNLKKAAKELAGGRVYSGQAALELGLVDEIGGLGAAINYIVQKANAENPDVILLPEPKSPMNALFSQDEEDSREIIRMQVPKSNNLVLNLQRTLIDSNLLGLLSHSQKMELQSFLSQLQAFQNQNILLLSSPLPKL